MSEDLIEVRGNASPEEMAVLLALVSRSPAPATTTPYEAWRRTRLAAMRRSQPGPERHR